MNSSAQFYTERLYPIQDGALKIRSDLKLPLYLTGGTTLSRHYLHHRYSNDLDLFVNNDQNFTSYVDTYFNYLTAEESQLPFKLDLDRELRREHFAQLYLLGDEAELKIDIVNDVPYHFGELVEDENLGLIDNWRNILSNKISAFFRFAAKDYVDVWALSRRHKFDWTEILAEAKYKEGSVDPPDVSDFIKTFPFEKLDEINWIEGFDYSTIREDFAVIAEDIFYGNKNRLA